MPTTNYFKVWPRGSREAAIFFFNDYEEASVHRALREARDAQQVHAIDENGKKILPPVSVFHRPMLNGPWADFPQIAGEDASPPYSVH